MDMEELLKKKVNGNLKKVKMKKSSKKTVVRDENYYSNPNISFNKRFDRVTTYIRRDLNREIRELKRIGQIKSITAFINAAIINELKKY